MRRISDAPPLTTVIFKLNPSGKPVWQQQHGPADRWRRPEYSRAVASQYAGTDEGLEALVQDLLDATRNGDEAQLRALASYRVANPDELFVTLLGQQHGPPTARAYVQRERTSRHDRLIETLRCAVAQLDNPRIEVQGEDTWTQQAHPLLLEWLESELTVADVVITDDSRWNGVKLAHWIFVDDRWLWLGELTTILPQRAEPEELVRLVSAALAALECGDVTEQSEIIESWRLPDPDGWLTRQFGQLGATLARDYDGGPLDLAGLAERHGGTEGQRWLARWRASDMSLRRFYSDHGSSLEQLPGIEQLREQRLEDGPLIMLLQAALEAKCDVSADSHVNPYGAPTRLQRLALMTMTEPTPLVTLRFDRHGVGRESWSWAYVDGRWRWLGTMAALEDCPAAAVLDGKAPIAAALDAWPPTTTGLERLVEAGVMLAGLDRREELEQLSAKLVVPEPRAFFATLLGEANAELAEEEYREEPSAAERFRKLAVAGALGVTIERVTPGVGHTMQQVLLSVDPSVEVYNCRHLITGTRGRIMTHNWHHDGQHWRLLGELWALRRDPRGANAWQQQTGYPGPGPHPFPGTRQGLAKLVERMLASVVDDDMNQLRWLGKVLELPEPEAWLHRVFEPSDELEAIVADYLDNGGRRVREAADGLTQSAHPAEFDVEVHMLVDPDPASDMRPPRRGPLAMREPVAVYAAELVPPDGDRPGAGLLPLVYVDGGWRLLGGLMRLNSAMATVVREAPDRQRLTRLPVSSRAR